MEDDRNKLRQVGYSMTLKDIVEQLESCGYECEGGNLEGNVAFIVLKKMASEEPEYRAKFDFTRSIQDVGFDWSVRAITVLQPQAGYPNVRLGSIKTIGDLVSQTTPTLMQRLNLGRLTIQEIWRFCDYAGLKLADGTPNEDYKLK